MIAPSTVTFRVSAALPRRSAVAGVCVLSLATASGAETFDMGLMRGAMICDHEASVYAAIDSEFSRLPVDCGQMTHTRMATWTIVGDHKGFPIVRWDFHNPVPWGNKVQYGFTDHDPRGVKL